MVLGIGCDVVEVVRMKTWLKNEKLLARYFTAKEIMCLEGLGEQRAVERLAGIFAAKESFIKAVMKGVRLTDIIIERGESGAPRMRLERSANKALRQLGATHAMVSISHEKNYAMAMVVVQC